MPTKPRAKPKTTATKNNACWDKVFVICGEPQLCKMALSEALGSLDNPGVKRYQRDDKPENVRASLNSFSLSGKPDAIIVYSPKADMLKVCQEAVESGFTASGLIIYNPGDSLDGRLSFTTASNKNKRVYHFDFIEFNNRIELTKYIKEWESGTGVYMTDEARRWLIDNAPTTSGKIKTNSGKKDAEVYNLELLENELDKPYVLHNDSQSKITLDDLKELCNFTQGHDVWAFIASAIAGDIDKAYYEIGRMMESHDVKTALALLMSQLKFLIGLKSLSSKYLATASEYDIAATLSLAPHLNRYLDENWMEREQRVEAPTVNPWRVKKACESSRNWSLEQLCKQYTATVYAYKDLRFGVPEDILIPYLMLALSGKIEYLEPITS